MFQFTDKRWPHLESCSGSYGLLAPNSSWFSWLIILGFAQDSTNYSTKLTMAFLHLEFVHLSLAILEGLKVLKYRIAKFEIYFN